MSDLESITDTDIIIDICSDSQISSKSLESVDAAIKSAYPHSLPEFKTLENTLSAVKRNGKAIEHVPKEFINKELCEIAIKTRYPCLNHIPKEYITYELCITAVRATGENVQWVPDELMTSELGFIAITSPPIHCSTSDLSGSYIQYIPAKYLTKEIIVESAKRWYYTYSTIPVECLNDDIENAVLDVSPYCISYMIQTPEKCMRAIKINPYVIYENIKKENITKEIAEYILSLNKNIVPRFTKQILEYLKSILEQ